jgi:hypothetical protein
MPGNHGPSEAGEIMQHRSRSPVHLILALIVALTAWPLMAVAQDATPPFAQQELPTEPPQNPSHDQPAIEIEQPPIMSGETAVPPTESPVGDTPSETPPDPFQEKPEQEQIPPAQPETAFVEIYLVQCEDGGRAGEVDFLISATSPTGGSCAPLSGDATFEMYLVSIESGQLYLYEGTSLQLPPGAYTARGSINGSHGESAPIALADDTQTFVQAIYYTPPSAAGDAMDIGATISVTVYECEDSDRAGELDILMSRPEVSASVEADCVAASAEGYSFTLVASDGRDDVMPPLSAAASVVSFADVPSGGWYVEESSTGRASGTFSVADGDTLHIAAIAYVGEPISVHVDKVYCVDDARAGTTEFSLNAVSTNVPGGTGGLTCHGAPLSTELNSGFVTLTNTETNETYTATPVSGSATFTGVAKGTYVVTETIDGESVTSEPLVLDLPDQHIQVTTFIAADDPLSGPAPAVGMISGTIHSCSSPIGDVDHVEIIASNESDPAQASTSECVPGGGESATTLTLVPVDPGTGAPSGDGQTILTDGVTFSQDAILPGTYILTYSAPDIGGSQDSAPFAVAPGSATSIDIRIFAAPAATTHFDVWTDVCVAPERAGTTSFHLLTDGDESSAMTESLTCRPISSDDGQVAYTLTHLESGQTWTQNGSGGEGSTFANLPAGTFALAHTYEGVTTTSHAFVLDPTTGQASRMLVRSYITEQVSAETPVVDGPANITIFSYRCSDPNHDGGYEWIDDGEFAPKDLNLVDESSADAARQTAESSSCQPVGLDDGIVFLAEPVDGGSPIEFLEASPGVFEQWDTEGIPAGDYIIRETSTGAVTGALRLTGVTSLRLLLFEELPEAEVTLTISFADPTVSNRLPDNTAWSVTSLRDPSLTFSGTIKNDNRSLPPSNVALGDLLTHGDYMVSVNASPTFQPYAEVFTVEAIPGTESGLAIREVLALRVVLEPVNPPPSTIPASTSPDESTPAPAADTDRAGSSTATATPGSSVARLPSTGGGVTGNHGPMLLLAALGATIAMTGSGLAIRRQSR